MATKKKAAATAEEEGGPVELGAFEVKAVNENGAEARLSDEREQSGLICRLKKANKQLEPRATYRVYAEKIADPPAPSTVVAEIPAEDAGSLPDSAEILEDR